MKFLFLLILLYPRAEFLPRVFDAGRILQGDKIKVDFKIKNKGDETLKIIDIKKDCGCTFAIPDKVEIPPSDSTFLRVGIVTEGKLGEFEEEIMVETNDPYEPYVRLTIRAHIFPVPKPKIKSIEIINVGEMYLGEIKDTFFWVENVGDAELILLEATPSASCEIISNFPIHIMPGKKEIVNIEVMPVKTGILNEDIRIATNIKEQLFYFIKISGKVIGNTISLFSPLVFKRKGDTLYILNSGKERIFIDEILIKKNSLASGINLKPGDKFKIILPEKIEKEGNLEIHLKLPYIIK